MNQFLKDILDQPAALQTALDHTLSAGLPDLKRAAQMIQSARRVVLTSMGSALYSLIPLHHELSKAHPCVHLLETAELLDELPADDGTLYLIMSRSGESGEVAAFSEQLHKRGLPLIAVTMTPTSTLAVNAGLVLHDPASYDGLICTKAYSTLTLVGLLLAAQISRTLTAKLTAALTASFEWLEREKESFRQAAAAVDWLTGSLYFLSYGVGSALTLSGALWLEEAARVPASIMSIANFLHGPVEQVDERFRGVWIDLSPDEHSRSMFSRASSHGGRWMKLMVDDPASDFPLISHGLPTSFRVLAAAMPVQLFAWQTAERLGIEAGTMRYLGWVVK